MRGNIRATGPYYCANNYNIAFVPGNPFYTKEGEVRTLRLNYTNSDATMIEEGIKRLGKVITTYKLILRT